MSDQCIQYNEEMVGAGHPTKADTLNRLALVEHNADGTHKYQPLGYLTGLTPVRTGVGELTFDGGAVEINGVIYSLDAQTAVAFTGRSNSAWHYVEIEAPTSGTVLAAAQFSISTTPPTRDHAKGGALYDASGDKRCIAAWLTNSSGEFLAGSVSGGVLTFNEPVLEFSSTGVASSITTLTLSAVPALGEITVNLSGWAQYSGYFEYYIGNGDGVVGSYYGKVMIAAPASSGATDNFGKIQAVTNDSQQIKHYANLSSVSVKLYVRSFNVPSGMAW